MKMKKYSEISMQKTLETKIIDFYFATMKFIKHKVQLLMTLLITLQLCCDDKLKTNN